MPRRAQRFDVFCRVVDNFGDAGVALRLSRQLAAEHAADVTLWIDDVAPLLRMLGVRSIGEGERLDGICFRALAALTSDADFPLPEVVVEAFGCGLPEAYLDAMERATRPPVWITLEYLSAEPWVDSMHGLPSPHPRRALSRWFVFPGFTRSTGGLIRERGLFAQRRRIEGEPMLRSAPWVSLGFPAPDDSALIVSLFCYANEALPALLDAWSREARPVACLVPEGVATPAIAAILGNRATAGRIGKRGALTLAVAPFVDQPSFDRRLLGSDLCIVRGEDSFVRAQWAARPFVWHIYPQTELAHVEKLAAFIDRYAASLDHESARALREFSNAFNEANAAHVVQAWPLLRDALPAIRAHAAAWADALADQRDLAAQLVDFASDRL